MNHKGTENKNKMSKTLEFTDPFMESRNLFSRLNDKFILNENRVKFLNGTLINNIHTGVVLYWMLRDFRVQDNWSLIYAQHIADRYQLPLKVLIFLNATDSGYYRRHFQFMLNGLIELEKDLNKNNVKLKIITGASANDIVDYVTLKDASVLVIDMNPMPYCKKIVKLVVDQINKNVVIAQVDAHNIVPVWIASNKVEFAARTIRPKINSYLKEYLTEFIPFHPHKFNKNIKLTKNNWKALFNYINENTDEELYLNNQKSFKGGYSKAVSVLNNFINYSLSQYAVDRNDPNKCIQSDLSPYLNFGFISCQRAIIEVIKHKKVHPESVAAFCEEAIIRRELSDNLCYYSDHTLNFMDWIPSWGKNTLKKHQNDVRPYDYTRIQLEKAETHDKLWNSAQIQMMISGKMHGFLRMYWCKKILEWTNTPQTALEDSIFLNNKYNLDGNDPNSITGCLWSIGGVHDRPWKERPIFGLIRYMNLDGCYRKFDVKKFIQSYSRYKI